MSSILAKTSPTWLVRGKLGSMDDALEYLGELDPDDPKQASQQIADRLRAAILTGKLAPGDKLPSQPDLVAHYGVARETVKRALDPLRAERLIVTRQGSGAFVRAQTQRAVELRPHIEAAFERPHVAIDFGGFSGETLRDALSEVLDKVRAGYLTPESIAVRVLISDMTAPMALPARAETQSDDPAVREQTQRRWPSPWALTSGPGPSWRGRRGTTRAAPAGVRLAGGATPADPTGRHLGWSAPRRPAEPCRTRADASSRQDLPRRY